MSEYDSYKVNNKIQGDASELPQTIDKIVQQLDIITRTLQLIEDRTTSAENRITDLAVMIREIAKKQAYHELNVSEKVSDENNAIFQEKN